jgi:peptide/nickel transport system substrate-binding protein
MCVHSYCVQIFTVIERWHASEREGAVSEESIGGRNVTNQALGRRAFLALGGGSVLALATACAAGSASSSGSGPAASNTLTFAIPSYPGSWDEDFIGFDTVALTLFKNVIPNMIDYAVTTTAGARVLDTSKIIPTFAESFTADATGKVWTLKLRKGLTFPSGNPMTAADVKWSKDRAFAAAANVAGIYRLIGLTEPGQVQVVDDYTVRFEQEHASALTPQIQAICLYVYDSKRAKQHATPSDPWAKSWMGTTPQDGGYFTVSSAVTNQQVVLAANKKYPGPNPPGVATIRMPVVPSTSNVLLQMQNGSVDVAMGLSTRDIKYLSGKQGIDVISSPSQSVVQLPMLTTAAPFNDVRVRQALAYALPYDQIIKNVYGGEARAVHSQVPLGMPGYTSAGYPYTYNLGKARALLQQAGKTNISTELAYSSGDTEQQQLAVLLASEFGKIGVKLQLSPLDPATFAQRREQNDIPIQITVGSWWVNDVEYLLAVSLVKGAAQNYSNYSNPAIEQIFAKSHTVTDTSQRLSMWKSVQEILATDVPGLVICQPNFQLPVRSGVTGWVQPVDDLPRLEYLKKS